MNTFGLLLGLATLFMIGLGFPLIIYCERIFGYLCWFYMMSIGVVLIVISIFVSLNWLSAMIGVLGATFVWGSTELKNQAVRTELGWYPYNPNKIKLPFSEIIEKWKVPHL